MLPIRDSESIMISDYPKYNKNEIFTTDIDDVIEFISMFRNKKAELGITSDYKVYIDIDNTISKNIVINMLKLNDKISNSLEEGVKVEHNGLAITIIYDNSKNIKEQEEKLIKEKETLEKSIERREKLLNNENYANKAPREIVDKDREALAKEKEILNNLLNKFTK